MSGAYWLKLYHEARIDRKLTALTDAQFRTWFNLLLYASEQEERGTIKGRDRLIVALETTNGNVKLLDECLTVFSALKMIKVEGDTITFLNFERRQNRPPSHMPEASRERKQRSREKQRLSAMSQETCDMSQETCDSHKDVTTPVTKSRVEQSRAEFGLLRNPLPFGSDVENDDTPDDPPPPKTRKPRKKKDEASTVQGDDEPKRNIPWELYEALCNEAGTAPLQGKLRDMELSHAKRLASENATPDDIRREYRWLKSQPWITAGVDMRLLAQRWAAWIAEGRPDKMKSRYIGARNKDIGLTDDELLQRINQGANGHDDAGRNDESVIDVSGRVVNGADHGSENRGLSRSPFSR